MQDVTVRNERHKSPSSCSAWCLLLNLDGLSPFGQSMMGCGLPLQLYRQRFIDFLKCLLCLRR